MQWIAQKNPQEVEHSSKEVFVSHQGMSSFAQREGLIRLLLARSGELEGKSGNFWGLAPEIYQDSTTDHF